MEIALNVTEVLLWATIVVFAACSLLLSRILVRLESSCRTKLQKNLTQKPISQRFIPTWQVKRMVEAATIPVPNGKVYTGKQIKKYRIIYMIITTASTVGIILIYVFG